MIMYYYENNNVNKFILMWFIDVSDNVQGSKDGDKDGDENDSSGLFVNPGKSFSYHINKMATLCVSHMAKFRQIFCNFC